MFVPSSELTFDTVQFDRRRLVHYIQTSQAEVVHMDLSAVTLCDSAGLALLIEGKRLCKRFKKKFELLGVPEVIYALAKFCDVEEMLVHEDE